MNLKLHLKTIKIVKRVEVNQFNEIEWPVCFLFKALDVEWL